MELHARELEGIRQIQEALRSPWMDRFFLGWNLVDTAAFFILLISIVCFLINRRIGLRLVYIGLLSTLLNATLKTLFELPRPCQIDPSVGLLCFSSPGFPSGAAQSAILYVGIVFVECRKWIYRILALLFALFLCFSRIYLGVHYFTDILGGLFFGGVLVLIYWKLFPMMEPRWKKVLFLFPVMLLLIGGSSAIYSSSLSVGLGIGLLMAQKSGGYWKKSLKWRWAQAFAACMGLFALDLGKTFFPHWKIVFGIGGGLWLSYLGAWSVEKIGSFFKKG